MVWRRGLQQRLVALQYGVRSGSFPVLNGPRSAHSNPNTQPVCRAFRHCHRALALTNVLYSCPSSSFNPLDWITRVHGKPAWLLVYALVAIPLLIGLIRGKAPGAKLALVPILAFPTTALAVLFVAMLRSSS